MRKDYYAILGVTRNSDQEAIKAAFRKKAMRLHPDKNPEDASAEEKFRELMEAYEILLDPLARKKYDQGSFYHDRYDHRASSKNQQGQKQKTYTFTEAEYFQRQEMARKYREKLKRKKKEEEENLPSYSDFKYIMLSIPLAIALLFFVINLSRGKNENELTEEQLKKLTSTEKLISPENNRDQSNDSVVFDMSVCPLQSYFPESLYDSIQGAVLRIENPHNVDAVICLENEKTKKVIRNAYVNAGYFFLMDKIPAGNYSVRVMYGRKWNVANRNPIDSAQRGMFDSVFSYVQLPVGKIRGKPPEEAKAFPYKEDKVLSIPDRKSISVSKQISKEDFFRK